MSEITIADFCHIHCHSQYSLLDGENKLDAFCNQAKTLGMNNIALTDHGTMMGALEFYKQAKLTGIKPILGVEAYLTDDLDDSENRTRDNFHLVMVAENNKGLENLYWLVSQAQLHNFYFKPRISKANLTPERVEGLIISSACLGSELNRKSGYSAENPIYDVDRVVETASWYKQVFGQNYHLEIQDNDDAAGQQKAYNACLKEVGKKLDLPLVITSDAHYTTLQQAETHSMIMAMQLQKTIEEYTTAGEMKYGPWFYVRSPEAMLEAARKYDCEEAFWNACKIGARCNVSIELGKYLSPTYDPVDDVDYLEFLKTRSVDEFH